MSGIEILVGVGLTELIGALKWAAQQITSEAKRAKASEEVEHEFQAVFAQGVLQTTAEILGKLDEFEAFMADMMASTLENQGVILDGQAAILAKHGELLQQLSDGRFEVSGLDEPAEEKIRDEAIETAREHTEPEARRAIIRAATRLYDPRLAARFSARSYWYEFVSKIPERSLMLLLEVGPTNQLIFQDPHQFYIATPENIQDAKGRLRLAYEGSNKPNLDELAVDWIDTLRCVSGSFGEHAAVMDHLAKMKASGFRHQLVVQTPRAKFQPPLSQLQTFSAFWTLDSAGREVYKYIRPYEICDVA